MRSLAGFDPLNEDEFDDVQDRIENDRTAAANTAMFEAETAKIVYLA